MPDIQAVFDQLIACEGIGNFTDEIAIARIGILIDVSSHLNRDDGIARALHWWDELAGRTLAEADAALIEYFRANAWATREQRRRKDDEVVWDWEQPELLRQILHLRGAARHPGYEKLDSPTQLCTNKEA